MNKEIWKCPSCGSLKEVNYYFVISAFIDYETSFVRKIDENNSDISTCGSSDYAMKFDDYEKAKKAMQTCRKIDDLICDNCDYGDWKSHSIFRVEKVRIIDSPVVHLKMETIE